jgi:hypothetical protein
MVSLKPLATGFVPAQGILDFFDPVFHIPPAVIDLDHFTNREPGVSHHKIDMGEKLAPVPLDFGHYPPGATSLLSSPKPWTSALTKRP